MPEIRWMSIVATWREEGTASGRFLHRRSPLGTAVFKGWTRKSNVACFKRPVPQKFSTVEKEPCKFPPAKFTSLFRRPSFSTVYQVFFPPLLRRCPIRVSLLRHVVFFNPIIIKSLEQPNFRRFRMDF